MFAIFRVQNLYPEAMSIFSKYKEVFMVLNDKEQMFTDVPSQRSRGLIFRQILLICLFAFIYGMVMGGYHSIVQSVVAGTKLMLLFIATLLISFPSLFVIQKVLGSGLNFWQSLLIILNGFVLASTIMLSFAPIVVFFLITGDNYHFIQLLHVAIFAFAWIFGIKNMVNSLSYAYKIRNVYPQTSLTVFKVWVVILAFVGVQLSWNLRPFLGDRDERFQLFRDYEGNFYTAIIYSFDQILNGPGEQYDPKLAGMEQQTDSMMEQDSSGVMKLTEE